MKAISYQLKSFNGIIYTLMKSYWELSLSGMSYDYKKKKYRQKSFHVCEKTESKPIRSTSVH